MVNAEHQTIEIEWQYRPTTYFEESIHFEHNGYSIEISNGLITARMDATVFDTQTGLFKALSQELNSYFLGAQPYQRKPFDISEGGTINRIYNDGRVDTNIIYPTKEVKYTTYRADIIHTDSEGIIHDTRKERIKAATNLSGLALRHASSDQTAQNILESFNSSVSDPDNELTHLYEVWEALSNIFGNGRTALFTLKISNTKKNRLGRLANNEPLNQGRHRGRFAGKLRDASTEELTEAREIATNMITSYLQYLDTKHQTE